MTDVAQGGPAGFQLGAVLGAAPDQAGLNQAAAHQITYQVPKHPSQLAGFGGMQPTGSGQLSHHSSEPLSHHSSGQLRQHPSGQMPPQLPQLPGQAQMSQQSSGRLSQQPSSQLSHYSSGQMAARQGSIPVGTDLITQGLRGSQIALELDAADRAQQQAASAAAAGLTNAVPTDMSSTSLSAPAAAVMPSTRSSDQAAAASLPLQGAAQTGLPHQEMPPGLLHQAAVPGILHSDLKASGGASQPTAGGYQHVPPADAPQMHREQMHEAGMHSSQEGLQQPHTGLPSAHQQLHLSHATHMHNSTLAPAVPANASSTEGNATSLGSPTIGLNLSEVHSPGLSEDALGGDQEFMDAMQAMSGQCMHRLGCLELPCIKLTTYCFTLCSLFCLK